MAHERSEQGASLNLARFLPDNKKPAEVFSLGGLYFVSYEQGDSTCTLLISAECRVALIEIMAIMPKPSIRSSDRGCCLSSVAIVYWEPPRLVNGAALLR
jgi:hypothetical protein